MILLLNLHFYVTTVPPEQLHEYNEEAGCRLLDMSDHVTTEYEASSNHASVSDLNIDILYPVRSTQSNVLKSPIDILIEGRTKLSELAGSAVDPDSQQAKKDCNKLMLEIINNTRQIDLELCISLLGGFMEQQDIGISLIKSQKDSIPTIGVAASAGVGVWALFSLDYEQIQPILAQCDGEKLLVKILDYVTSISGVMNDDSEDSASSSTNSYAAKLQFIAHGMAKTVTCNTQYVSYSLERQLVEFCKERSIKGSISLSDLQSKWGTIFKGKTLSLVERRYRPLVGRWLKWALMIHNLREELAKYTVIGVSGLVNSGKSKLINILFGLNVRITTVPMHPPTHTHTHTHTHTPGYLHAHRSLEITSNALCKNRFLLVLLKKIARLCRSCTTWTGVWRD